MAVIYYPPGELSSGFSGFRVATTLGSESDYVQEWFSLNDYGYEKAKRLAHAKNKEWREKAESIVDSRLADYRSWKSLSDVPGLFAAFVVDKKVRRGRLFEYATPAIQGSLKTGGRLRNKAFRITGKVGSDYPAACEAACKWLIEERELPMEALDHLLSIMPDISYFYEDLYEANERIKGIISKSALIKKLHY